MDWNGRFLVIQRNIVKGVLTSIARTTKRRRRSSRVDTTTVSPALTRPNAGAAGSFTGRMVFILVRPALAAATLQASRLPMIRWCKVMNGYGRLGSENGGSGQVSDFGAVAFAR